MKVKTSEKLPAGFHQEDNELWAIDLVCGMDVKPVKAPYHGLYNGKRYYFCSKGCKEHFDNTPSRYAD